MITQIELDGFKTFKDFKIELAPFQVIVGPNGVGKSNLFDALRQVLVTTHSPTLVSLPEVLDALMLAIKVTRVEPHQSTLEVTRMVPVPTPNTQSDFGQNVDRDTTIEIYTIDQIKKYLSRNDTDEVLARLEQARTTLLEGGKTLAQ